MINRINKVGQFAIGVLTTILVGLIAYKMGIGTGITQQEEKQRQQIEAEATEKFFQLVADGLPEEMPRIYRNLDGIYHVREMSIAGTQQKILPDHCKITVTPDGLAICWHNNPDRPFRFSTVVDTPINDAGGFIWLKTENRENWYGFYRFEEENIRLRLVPDKKVTLIGEDVWANPVTAEQEEFVLKR